MEQNNTVTWTSPANIALIKYWGKYGNQLPSNPSISMTLSRSVTRTRMSWQPATGIPDLQYTFDGKPEQIFETRIRGYLEKILPELPELAHYSLIFNSSNTFPHSSGISSSASFMSSLALCLLSAACQITGNHLTPSEFFRKASHLARLGSGSAARSVYGGFNFWGRSTYLEGSSDEHALQLNHLIHPVFRDYGDAVLVVSSKAKSLASSAGHKLMETHPFAVRRYESAHEKILGLMAVLTSGDQEGFIRIVEEEALTLHGLIMASDGGPILLEPRTLSLIRLIRDFRNRSGSRLCFTLDAGPNVHLLYPASERELVINFIENALLPLCEDRQWIDDLAGGGPEKAE